MKNSHSESYAAAGVDVTAGYEAVNRIKPLVESTYIPGVMGSLGGFGGLFAPNVAGMKKPVLVSGTDGVGTKLKIAFLMDKHDTVGIDCVAMCVNDIVCSGASPLFFLDYVAVGKNVPSRIAAIVSGVTEGCRPGRLRPHRRRDRRDARLLPRGRVRPGRLLRGSGGRVRHDRRLHPLRRGCCSSACASYGVHSNGFSLVRKVLRGQPQGSGSIYVSELGRTMGEALLTPHPHLCKVHPMPAPARRNCQGHQPHHRRRPV